MIKKHFLEPVFTKCHGSFLASLYHDLPDTYNIAAAFVLCHGTNLPKNLLLSLVKTGSYTYRNTMCVNT